jgi:hypothetical protein
VAAQLRPRGGLERELAFEAPAAEGAPGLGAVVPLGPRPEALLVQEGGRAWRLPLGEGAAERLADAVLAFGATRGGGAEWMERPDGGPARLGRLTAVGGLGAPIFEAVAGDVETAVAGACGPREAADRGRFAWRLGDGSWSLGCGAGTERPPEDSRVVAACPSPVRGGAPGLVLRGQRELAFLAPATWRATDAGPAGEAWAACPVAPWLLERQGRVVTLREIGRRWGRRLARWELDV